MIEILIAPIIAFISLSTSFGVMIHEVKLDRLADLSGLSVLLAQQNYSFQNVILKSSAHNHIDSGIGEPANGSLRTQNPSTTPRRDKDEKYRLPKKISKGILVFDSWYLPR